VGGPGEQEDDRGRSAIGTVIRSSRNGLVSTRGSTATLLAAGTGTLLYTTGASSVTPAPVFVSAGMAGATLRKWALTLNDALAGTGIYAGHVAIGTWIAGTPGAPEGAPGKEPDDIARLYWDLHTDREPAEHLISA
jgi:hypothetical protein